MTQARFVVHSASQAKIPVQAQVGERTVTAEPTGTRASLSSGTANTTSRGPSWAMRTTGVPAATTWPASASRTARNRRP